MKITADKLAFILPTNPTQNNIRKREINSQTAKNIDADDSHK